jgi:hypothetical protein
MAAARAIGEEWNRAVALSDVAARLPDSLLAAALDATFSVCNESESASTSFSCLVSGFLEPRVPEPYS